MIDLDHFKKVNDTHGHTAGDMVLVQVAHVIRESCREADLVGPYGGEEIAFLAPNTGREGVLVLAEKIRMAVDGLSIGDVSGHQITVTVSVGHQGPGGGAR